MHSHRKTVPNSAGAKQLIALVCLLLSASCLSGQDQDKYILYQRNGYEFPYHVNEPDDSWELPYKLVEISGLSYVADDRLACVQDEKGNIYIFDTGSGEVETKIDFGEDGDYEGIEIVGKDAWVLKSNGTLYQVKGFLEDDEPDTEKHPTELTGKNDAEGLCYDPVTGNLLIACKGHPFLNEKKGKEFKAIYRFNLSSFRLDPDPELLIVMDSVKYYKDYNTMAKLGVELLALIDDSKGDLSFQPSGIAIHPFTGNLYVIGSVGDLLMVFSRDGQMLFLTDLRSKHFPQPEGICFDPDGNLYISNEGAGGRGVILKFDYMK